MDETTTKRLKTTRDINSNFIKRKNFLYVIDILQG